MGMGEMGNLKRPVAVAARRGPVAARGLSPAAAATAASHLTARRVHAVYTRQQRRRWAAQLRVQLRAQLGAQYRPPRAAHGETRRDLDRAAGARTSKAPRRHSAQRKGSRQPTLDGQPTADGGLRARPSLRRVKGWGWPWAGCGGGKVRVEWRMVPPRTSAPTPTGRHCAPGRARVLRAGGGAARAAGARGLISILTGFLKKRRYSEGGNCSNI